MLINLLGLTKEELQALAVTLGGKSYNGTQIFKWIYKYGIDRFELMTDLSKQFRMSLVEQCEIVPPTILSEHKAVDGTIKWLITVGGGSVIETVYIPAGKRATLCISSQAGCMLNCDFCHTGKQGFSKNLTVTEIIGQLWLASKRAPKRITNVVMMGMGEPLLNFTALKPALSIMRDDLAYQLAKRRVTVSTSGVVPGIYQLANECEVALALSLHAPNDQLRDRLVPLNKKYPLAELLTACKYFLQHSANTKITIEYVMLAGVNDGIEHAKQLIKLLHQLPCKINLIPFNPFVGTTYSSTSPEQIKLFSEILMRAGFVVTVRRTRGEDLNAACGQLAGMIKDRTKRSKRYYDLVYNLNNNSLTNTLT